MTATMSFFVAPLALAAGKDLNTAAGNIQKLIQTATTIVYMLAFLAFFWGLAMYLFQSSEEKKKQAVTVLVTSIIVIFVMTSIWGIVKVLQSTLGADDTTVQDIQIPGIDFRN